MSVNYFPTAYFNGEYRPFAEATVSIATHALQYGSGVFGGIRGYKQSDGQIGIFRLPDHVKRVRNSARLLGIEIEHSEEMLVNLICQLVVRNHPESDIYIRPFAYKSGLDIAPGMHGVADGLAIYMAPLGRFYDTSEQGLSVKISSWRRIEDNAIPARAKISGAYVNSSLAKDEAVACGYDDAILLNEDGSVSEGSSSNLAIVRDGTIITPPVSDNILEGITRKSLLALAVACEIPVIERSVDRTELYIADEVLFAGTAVEVSWVAKIDGRPIGNELAGDVYRRLSARFEKVVRGQDKAFADWMTIVSM